MILKRTYCVFSIKGSFRIFVSGTGVESLPYVCLLGRCRSYTRHAARRLIEEREVILSHWDGHCFAPNQYHNSLDDFHIHLEHLSAALQLGLSSRGVSFLLHCSNQRPGREGAECVIHEKKLESYRYQINLKKSELKLCND